MCSFFSSKIDGMRNSNSGFMKIMNSKIYILHLSYIFIFYSTASCLLTKMPLHSSNFNFTEIVVGLREICQHYFGNHNEMPFFFY